SHGVRGRGAAMTYLSHKASFHSRENITPSNPGTKHLGLALLIALETLMIEAHTFRVLTRAFFRKTKD
ncbi:hypothetical protein, partial [Gluconobacter vitians]|uniref:hypothetical protein n=1 Tax=Gluconobacter vitians TaxID=2728102 RepID=UPI001D1709CC